MPSSQTLQYWLATSAVEFTGTQTVATPTHGGPAVSSFSADAALIVRADRVQGAVPLTVHEGALSETKFSLSFTDDGRLASTDVAVTGAGAQVLGSIAAIAGAGLQLAKAVTPEALLPMNATPVQPAGADTAVARPFPQQDLLDNLSRCQDDLASRLIAGANGDAAPDKDALDSLDTALRLVTQEHDRLVTEQVAWTTAATSTATSFDYILDVEELPTSTELLAGLTEQEHTAALRVWNDLECMATLDSLQLPENPTVGDDEGPAAPFQATDQSVIWFRRERRARMTVWAKKASGSAVPTKISDVSVLDKHCRHLSLPLELAATFRKTDFNITFSANGTPTTIGADRDSAVAAVATALGGLPKQISGGISDVAGIGTAWNKAHPSADTKQIDALKQTQTELKLRSEIAKLQKPNS